MENERRYSQTRKVKRRGNEKEKERKKGGTETRKKESFFSFQEQIFLHLEEEKQLSYVNYCWERESFLLKESMFAEGKRREKGKRGNGKKRGKEREKKRKQKAERENKKKEKKKREREKKLERRTKKERSCLKFNIFSLVDLLFENRRQKNFVSNIFAFLLFVSDQFCFREKEEKIFA